MGELLTLERPTAPELPDAEVLSIAAEIGSAATRRALPAADEPPREQPSSGFDFQAWLAKQTEASAVPLKVTDRATLRQAAHLLRGR